MLAVQDEIAENIAAALNHTFARTSTQKIELEVFDLYLRAIPNAYSPNELAAGVALLEVATQRAPHFIEVCGRLAYLRGLLHVYLPFGERAQSAERVVREASYALALALDAENVDALAARGLVTRPFGDFETFDRFLSRLCAAPGTGDGKRYTGWLLRHTGRLRESLEVTQRTFAIDSMDSMSINLMALAYMACGRPDAAARLYADLVERYPSMSFPISSLLRAYAFLEDWKAVDGIIAMAATRPLREFQDTIPFVRASATRPARRAWRGAMSLKIGSPEPAPAMWRVWSTLRILVSWTRPTALRRRAALGRRAPPTTSWVRMGIARRCSLRTTCQRSETTRAFLPCVRGWASSMPGSIQASGPIVPMKFPTTSGPDARRMATRRRTGFSVMLSDAFGPRTPSPPQSYRWQGEVVILAPPFRVHALFGCGCGH